MARLAQAIEAPQLRHDSYCCMQRTCAISSEFHHVSELKTRAMYDYDYGIMGVALFCPLNSGRTRQKRIPTNF